MDRIIYITSKIFNAIFTRAVDATASPIERLILQFRYNPYLCIGAAMLIIGFSIGLIKRIIRS